MREMLYWIVTAGIVIIFVVVIGLTAFADIIKYYFKDKENEE